MSISPLREATSMPSVVMLIGGVIVVVLGVWHPRVAPTTSTRVNPAAMRTGA